MKNLDLTSPLKISILVYFFTLLASCDSGSKKMESSSASLSSCPMSFAGEDSIDLGPHILDTATAENEILQFPSIASTTAAPHLALLIDSISASAFCGLRDSAIKMHDLDSTCTNFITGLKISYGLSVNFGKITLLFQPVYLCRTSKVSNKGSYNLFSDPSVYYQYDPATTTFTLATDTSALGRYRAEILISHSGSEPPSHFRPAPLDNDTLGDVGSLVYTFQEIAALIRDNNNSSYIKLWNAVQDMQIPSVGYSLRKLTVVLGPPQIAIPLSPFTSSCTAGGFCNNFANLQGLCPPSCIELKYILY